jgi:Raf kinase inhibitor-like YbhB/YbcL family protein
MAFALKVAGFADGAEIPRENTGDGANSSPALEWLGEPEGTRSFALIVDDPDAPMGTWNHWLLWDIPAHIHSLAANFQPGATGASGANDFRRPGYGGPYPPRGHGRHRYFFKLYAIDRSLLGLPPGSRRDDLDRALRGRTIGEAQYMGTYERR